MELQLDPIYQFVSGHTLPICRENESVKKFFLITIKYIFMI